MALRPEYSLVHSEFNDFLFALVGQEKSGMQPMLAVSAGRLILLGTPNGRRGHFFEAWESDEDWERIEVPASECPRISPAFLESERSALGESWFNQEYCCRFLDAVGALFRYEDIRRAISDEVEPLFPTKSKKQAEPGRP